MHTSHLQPTLNASSPQGQLKSIPPVFCWTKMGTEAGQSLDGILRRKELERRAGHGLFAWGIGNSLGVAAKLAQEEAQDSEVEVLFTPMRSAAKQVDVAPSQVLLWLGYFGENGEQMRLPNHMLITSRGNLEQGGGKRSHYALICDGQHDITIPANMGVIDANRTRNFASLNPLGASQVTAVVRYHSTRNELAEKFYPVTFRAKLHGPGFVRLASPVVLDEELAVLYRQVCMSLSANEWIEGAMYLRQMADLKLIHQLTQQDMFREAFAYDSQVGNYSINTREVGQLAI